MKVLLVPALDAWPLFRREESAAGPVAGVEAVSEALSIEEGRAAGLGEDEAGDGSLIFGGELELFLPFSFGLANRPSSFGDSLRTTIALEGPDLLERRPLVAEELAEVVAGIVSSEGLKVCCYPVICRINISG